MNIAATLKRRPPDCVACLSVLFFSISESVSMAMTTSTATTKQTVHDDDDDNVDDSANAKKESIINIRTCKLIHTLARAHIPSMQVGWCVVCTYV